MRQGGASPAMLEGPACPPELAYLWSWFGDLHAGRTINGMGPSAATHGDIAAWQFNFRVRAETWELRILIALGAEWASVMREASTTKKVK